MRPQLFRMASELQPNEEGMTDIIQTNDALIRVLDHYERVVGPKDEGQGSKDTPATNASGQQSQNGGSSQSNQNGSSSGGGVKDGGSGGASDLLLDLADLNFGTTQPTGSGSGNSDFGIPGQSCCVCVCVSCSTCTVACIVDIFTGHILHT